MELHVYLTFVIATTIMIALPGPSVLLTVSHSISFGWKHALFTVAGATIGIAVQLIVAANVRGLLQSRRAFQLVLRTAGGLLITAGVGLALARRGN